MPLFGRIGRPGLLGLAARTAIVAGTATAVTGGIRRRRRNRYETEQQSLAYEEQQRQDQVDAAAAKAAQDASGTANAQPAPIPQVPSSAAAVPSEQGALLDQLKQLADLHSAGALTDDEFAAAKAKLLG
ncbi:SHOCT domain-containing protein [Lysinibacter cavernae]|uniref:SHOCT domain-containing protein n=1 Tax=Lysinibacter cavernae TaxID=1640652 RepID=A0A7X5QZ06_9MICO|nr:SHOCT domain-containing protein [Lysinibacter cavernae]NIH52608.1 hypothetical protein [Lysinibacter cavernae]